MLVGGTVNRETANAVVGADLSFASVDDSCRAAVRSADVLPLKAALSPETRSWSSVGSANCASDEADNVEKHHFVESKEECRQSTEDTVGQMGSALYVFVFVLDL